MWTLLFCLKRQTSLSSCQPKKMKWSSRQTFLYAPFTFAAQLFSSIIRSNSPHSCVSYIVTNIRSKIQGGNKQCVSELWSKLSSCRVKTTSWSVWLNSEEPSSFPNFLRTQITTFVELITVPFSCCASWNQIKGDSYYFWNSLKFTGCIF